MENVLDPQGTIIHTVLLTASKRAGLAIGVDENGPFRIWLRTPKAVAIALEKINALANTLQTKPARSVLQDNRARKLYRRHARSWELV